MKKLLIICMLIFATFINAQETKTYKNLSKALKNPEKVYRLDLNFARIGVLPDSIGLLTNLTYLRLSSNNLKQLPEAILKLKNLIELDVSFNELENLPRGLGKLKNLTKLKIGSNKITKLPESIGDLNKLTYLDVSFNNLTFLPESIGNLSSLQILKINSNRLTSLPNSITNLKNLSRLDMEFNNYTSLPSGIVEMDNLENIEQITTFYDNFISKQEQKKIEAENEAKRLEEISHYKYLLNFTNSDLENKKTGKFDEEKAYEKLPWKINDIYEYLSTKNEFIYNAKNFSFEKDKVTGTVLIGYKIEKKDKIIESHLYNFTKKQMLPMRGMFADINFTIRKDSTSASMKFMPFLPLMTFRTLDRNESVTIKNKTYDCTIVEGFFMFQKIRYWMVTNTPGLIVKMISESTYNRRTWTLKEVK